MEDPGAAAAGAAPTAVGAARDVSLPPALCISLKHRTDRRAQFELDFAEAWPAPIEILDAIYNADGWRGCALSHAAAVRLAQSRGWTSVLILEDDAKLAHAGAVAQLRAVLPCLDEKWDAFSLAPTVVVEREVRGMSARPPYVFEAPTFGCSSYVLHERAYARLLDALTEDAVLARTPEAERLRIDVLLAQCFRQLTTLPLIASQAVSWSDISYCVSDVRWGHDHVAAVLGDYQRRVLAQRREATARDGSAALSEHEDA